MSMVLNVDQMSLEEKLRTMELLWENRSRREEGIPVPQWHKDLLDERERAVKEGRAQFITWESAKARIASETK